MIQKKTIVRSIVCRTENNLPSAIDTEIKNAKEENIT